MGIYTNYLIYFFLFGLFVYFCLLIYSLIFFLTVSWLSEISFNGIIAASFLLFFSLFVVLNFVALNRSKSFIYSSTFSLEKIFVGNILDLIFETGTRDV